VTAYLDGFTGRLVTTEWVLMEGELSVSVDYQCRFILSKKKELTPITASDDVHGSAWQSPLSKGGNSRLSDSIELQVCGF
jgi:hypothetical protein